ncbi:hypothetical protein WDU94_001326 [Cyamophila willieti]
MMTTGLPLGPSCYYGNQVVIIQSSGPLEVVAYRRIQDTSGAAYGMDYGTMVRRTRSFLTTIQNADRNKNATRDEVATSDMAYCGVFRSYNEHGAMPNPESSPTPTLSSRVARWQQTTSPCGLSCELNTEQVTSVLHPCESCVANSWIGDTLSVTSFETGHSTQYKQGGGGPNGFGGPNGYSSPSPSTPMGSTSRLVAENQKNKVRRRFQFKVFF